MDIKYPLYTYQWYDHFSSSSWKTLGDVRSPAYLVHGVGYLIDEDKDYLYFSDGLVLSTGQTKGSMAVLKSALKSKKKIK